MADRRQDPRVEVDDQITGELIERHPILIRDIGLGGMVIQCLAPMRVGEVHLFVLRTSDGAMTEARARVVHTMRSTAADGQTLYLAGLAFFELDERLAQAIGGLVDQGSLSLIDNG
jgi:hypothetical protein